MSLLEIKDLVYRYPDGSPALNGVSFALERSEKLAVIGANGSGKSTLLAHLAGCLPAGKGEIALADSKVVDLASLRDAVGLIFQDPDDQLFMPRVLEDVAFGLVAARKMSVEDAHKRAMTVLETLAVAHLANRPPHRLSGGEKRMVALAGILAMDPRIVMLDEPSAALDPRARKRVIDVLSALDKPLILATHDLDMALDVCTRALVMNDGRVAATGDLPGLLKDESLLRANGLELPLRYGG